MQRNFTFHFGFLCKKLNIIFVKASDCEFKEKTLQSIKEKERLR